MWFFVTLAQLDVYQSVYCVTRSSPHCGPAVQEVLRETGGDGVGRACEMSGSDAVLTPLLRCLRKGGGVVLVGLQKKPIHIEDPLPNFSESVCVCECV